MPVGPGTRIGAYEVIASLGAGGMGEVYRARDTKLGRDVAIKVLPEAVAQDLERLARFEREARTLAALNHPNIATIYGFDEASRALVMELVGGKTLEQILQAQGPRPKAQENLTPPNSESGLGLGPGALGLTETLQVTRQIADALDAAHEIGIVHRDLKPANVKVRDDGTVKVLDFGLAKALDANASGASADQSNSPTITSPATAIGMILGTAAYMSPEQARGRAVDKRADIWAFGVVMFELLTGKRLFEGETISDTLAAVLRQDIPWSQLPAGTPPRIVTLLERCLEREPKRRLRDIGDARHEIEDVLSPRSAVIAMPLASGSSSREVGAAPSTPAPQHPAPQHPPPQHPPPSTSRGAWPWIVAALGIVATAAVAIIGAMSGTVSEPAWSQFTQLTDAAGEETYPAISPDGASIAYASRAKGSLDIYVQRIGGRNPAVVAGDPARNESAPAFSPDGMLIAFHEHDGDGGIFVVGATGESVRRVSDVGFHPAWSPDGKTIVFCDEPISTVYTRTSISSLRTVPAAGGAPVRVDTGTQDAVQGVFSPSGTHIAFWGLEGGWRDLFVVAIGGGAVTRLTRDVAIDWAPHYSPDGRWLYFASDRGGVMNLWRLRLDPATNAARGEPEPVSLGVGAAMDRPSFSRDGTRLVFRSQMDSINPVAVPFDPDAETIGVPVPLVRRTGSLLPFSVSPDGAWLAYTNLGERQEDIFVSRTDGSELRRLTDDAARDRSPVWSPDGREIAFYSNREGDYAIWVIRPDGSGLTKISSGPSLNYPIYSPDGRRMLATQSTAAIRQPHVWDRAKGWASHETLDATSFADGDAALLPLDWSPDGSRIAGTMMTIKGGVTVGIAWHDGKLRRGPSINSAYDVSWLPDGRRLLVGALENVFAIVDTQTGRRKDLPVPAGYHLADESMALSRDGKRIYFGDLRRESDIWMVEKQK